VKLSYAIFTLLSPGIAGCALVMPCVAPDAARSPFDVSQPPRAPLHRSEVLTRQRAYRQAIATLETHTRSPQDGACVEAEVQGRLGDLYATVFDPDAALAAYRRHLDSMGGADSAYGRGPDGRAVAERMRLLSDAVQRRKDTQPPETYGQAPTVGAPPLTAPAERLSRPDDRRGLLDRWRHALERLGAAPCDAGCAQQAFGAWSGRLAGDLGDIVERAAFLGVPAQFDAVVPAGRTATSPAVPTASAGPKQRPPRRAVDLVLAAVLQSHDFTSSPTPDGVRVVWSGGGTREAVIDHVLGALQRRLQDGGCLADDLIRLGVPHVDLSTRLDPRTIRITLDPCISSSGSPSKDVP